MSPEQIALIDSNWERMKAQNEAVGKANAQAAADSEKRRAAFQQYCDGYHLMVYKGDNHPDFQRGLALIKLATVGGDPMARLELAELAANGRAGLDPSGARATMQQLSNTGDSAATGRLAGLLLAGIGGPRDIAGAARLYVLRDVQTHGFLDTESKLVPRDAAGQPRSDEAALAQWCEAMAARHDSASECALAELCVAGRGIAPDRSRAIDLWLRAAHSYGLGLLAYQIGRRPADLAEAVAAPVAPMLRGRGLEIVDEQGRLRAQLTIAAANTTDARPWMRTAETVIFRLITADGKPRVKLTTSDNGSGFMLLGDSDATHTILQANGGQTFLLLRNDETVQKVITP